MARRRRATTTHPRYAATVTEYPPPETAERTGGTHHSPDDDGGGGTTEGRIDALLDALRRDTVAALGRLTAARDDAARHRAAADTATRAYATEWRGIRARGLLTPAQLREAGYPPPAPRRPRRDKRAATP